MSNDPNRRIEQDRGRQQRGGHNTLETYQIEKQNAPLPAWQKYLVYGLAVVGAIALIGLALSALGII